MSSSTITKPYITENWLHMKKDQETKETVKLNVKLTQRRKSLGKPEGKQSIQGPHLIKLSENFLDDLEKGKRQELAKLNRKNLPVVTSPLPRHLTEPINDAKRRTSAVVSPLPKTDRRYMTQFKNAADQLSRRRPSTNSVKSRDTTTTSPPKQTIDTIKQTVTKGKLLDQPRRRTMSSGSLLQDKTKVSNTQAKAVVVDADFRRRHSHATTVSRMTSRRSIKSSEDEKSICKKSILAAASSKARLMSQCEQKLTQSNSESSANEKKSDSLSTRRMSRTENLKDGLPTSPSMAARFTRRKSQVKKEDVEKAVKSGRMRGKTLPGNLAKPPQIHSLKLPPMNLAPINLNMPSKTKRNSIVTKSPSIKARATSSNKTTPIPTLSRSSSPIEDDSLKRTQSTRKGLKSASSKPMMVTPSLKASPVSATSPRVRPKSTKQTELRKANDLMVKRTSVSGYNMARRKSGPEKPVVDLTHRRKSDVSGTKKVPSEKTNYDPSIRRKSSPILGASKTKSVLANKTNYDLTQRRKSDAETMKRKNAQSDFSARRKSNMDEVKMTAKEIEFSPRLMTLTDQLKVMVKNHPIKDSSQLNMASELGSEFKLDQTFKDYSDVFNPDKPKNPAYVRSYYRHHLSAFEQVEILYFPEIYYMGKHSKKIPAIPENKALNYGYDDDRGDYKIVINDHLAYRYEILEELGRGSFGQVVKCFDHKRKKHVAIKLIRNKQRFYDQAKTEVKILSDLVRWDPEDKYHTVRMTDYFSFRKHLCIVCECLDINLYELIKLNNFKGFSISVVRGFTIQILKSLSLLAKNGVIHCDLKPENILLKRPYENAIKVIDFGSSCSENEKVYTYIQSRFYRAPEIILGLYYTKAIDMWSLGCIIVELYTGIPIFPGQNEQEQLAVIMEMLDVPDIEIIRSSERKHLFFDIRNSPKIVCNSKGNKLIPGSKSLSRLLNCDDALFLDFIQQCLMWDPSKRLTPETALYHDWILQALR